MAPAVWHLEVRSSLPPKAARKTKPEMVARIGKYHLLSLFLILSSVIILPVNGRVRGGEDFSNSEDVKVEVYFRAFCPACQWLMSGTLSKLVSNPAYGKIIDLDLVPAGGMEWTPEGKMDCEGGDLECNGHRYYACAIDSESTMFKALTLIECMEGEASGVLGRWKQKLHACAGSKLITKLKTCYSDNSTELLRALIGREHAADPGWFPYVLVNGEPIGSASEGLSLSLLKKEICNAYKGSYRPDDCPVETIKESEEKIEEEDNRDESDEEEAALDSAVAKSLSRVRMEYYWRAYCPACKWSLTGPMPRLLGQKKMQDILEFDPVPAAGTTINEEGAHEKFSCTSGPKECEGHKYLGCAVKVFPNVAEQAEALSCLESKRGGTRDWKEKTFACFQGDKLTRMRECYDAEGESILEANARRVEEMGGAKWMPYIVLNGNVIGDAKTGFRYDDLVTEICAAFSADPKNKDQPAPRACVSGESTTDEGVEDEPIKPCNKAKTGAVYEDPPDIGPISRKRLLEGRVEQLHLYQPEDAAGKVSPTKMLLAMFVLCLCIVGLFYYQLTRKTKSLNSKKK